MRAIVAMMVVGLAAGSLVGGSLISAPQEAHAQAAQRRRPQKGPHKAEKNSNARPLHDWMEHTLVPVVEAGDTARLAELYTQMARFAPDPSWNQGATSWTAIAGAGAEKARAGDLRGARAACKQCHTAWKERYRSEFASRPLPR